MLPINRNLIITGNGSLTLDNVTLMMNPSFNGEYHIEVQSGGQLYIYNSNITSANEYHYLFWVRNNSRFEMRDSELHGCGWDLNNKGLTVEASNVHINNCTFSNNYIGILLDHSSDNTISNCNIYNNYDGIYLCDSSNNNIVNCAVYNNDLFGIDLWDSSNNNITNCAVYNHYYHGISLWRCSNKNQMTNCDIYNNSYAVFLDSSSNNSIINFTITNSSNYDIYLQDSHLSLLNTTFNRTLIYNSILTVSWYLDMNILWNNIGAEYADVTIIDSLMVEVFNDLTDKNGWIKDIVIQEYTVQGDTTTYFTPYTITASKNGYYSSEIAEINQNMEIIIYLEDVTPPNADAGEDQEVDGNTIVYFNGSNSTDNSGIITNYTWTFVDNDVEVTLYGISQNYTFRNFGVFL